MHGTIHDYIVIKTIPKSENFPSGLGKGVIKDWLPTINSTIENKKYEKILEIGSLDICGSQKTYNYCDKGDFWRHQVGCKEYIGIDLIEGKDVDIVMNAHKLDFKDNSFDLVLCMSMLEHDTNPQATILEAYRVTKKGQPFILTTVDEKHPEHKHLGGGDTETYNFITEKMLKKWLKNAGFINCEVDHVGTDLFVYALK
jgi:SAM-dependent methyltransferase